MTEQPPTPEEYLEYLRTEHEILTAFLDIHTNEIPPTGEGLKITHQIFVGALTDTTKTLGSMIDFLERKNPVT